MNALLMFIIAILVVVVVYLSILNEKNVVKCLEEEKQALEEIEKKKQQGLKEVEIEIAKERKIQLANLQREKDNIAKEVANQQEVADKYKTTKLIVADREIALYKEEQMNKITTQLIRLDNEQQRELEKKQNARKQSAEKEMEELLATLEEMRQTCADMKAKRDITLELIKEEEKIKQEKDFYRIVLKDEDIEDIKQLMSIKKYLHNQDVLHKLIYKTYIEVPMNSMFGRIGAKEVSGVYKITNLNNNMTYIGQSTNVRNRLRAHIQSSIGISTIASQLVHDKMAEEGLQNFTFQIIEECPKEKLNDREKYYINYYDSNNYGYNRTKGNSN